MGLLFNLFSSFLAQQLKTLQTIALNAACFLEHLTFNNFDMADFDCAIFRMAFTNACLWFVHWKSLLNADTSEATVV